MSLTRSIGLGAIAWITVITLLHGWLNLRWFEPRSSLEKFKVGFIPVTCHLTCPVTDFINKSTKGENFFEPMRFSGFPELKETFLAGDMPATFILAPLAIALREQGVPIKIVYLGHRDGTAMMVHKDSSIRRIEDLRGKRIAIPNRFSNQRLLIFKALKDRGIPFNEVELLEMPPPDMPAALYSKSVDAITAGEPYMGQTEMDGYGRVLYLTKDVWPNFISCVLAVNENSIKTNRAQVQMLVDGIARSGKWLDSNSSNRMEAATFVGELYYNQSPELMRFVLSKPPDRVKYTNLKPLQKEFEEIERLGKDSGILTGTSGFADYVDDSFVQEESSIQPHDYGASKISK
ncbi:MAG: ABC transporter substrate-binding protein [Verrucomicrobiota bacterium]|nr:ABC transporter substrate-binding protein [Verrucomicrobiota bacterium]